MTCVFHVHASGLEAAHRTAAGVAGRHPCDISADANSPRVPTPIMKTIDMLFG